MASRGRSGAGTQVWPDRRTPATTRASTAPAGRDGGTRPRDRWRRPGSRRRAGARPARRARRGTTARPSRRELVDDAEVLLVAGEPLPFRFRLEAEVGERVAVLALRRCRGLDRERREAEAVADGRDRARGIGH